MMAHFPHSSTLHSLTLDIDAPDIQTPVFPHVAPSDHGHHLQTYFATPGQPLAQIPEASDLHRPLTPSYIVPSANRSLVWETEAMAPLQVPGFLNLTASPLSVTPALYELPQAIPTPAQNLHRLVDHTQRGWEKMHTKIKEQITAVYELTASLENENISTEPLKCLGNQFRENHREMFTLVKEHRETTVMEMDKLVKGIKQMIEEELKNSTISLLSEVRFMVEQLQMETQQDLKVCHTATQESIANLSQTVTAMSGELNS